MTILILGSSIKKQREVVMNSLIILSLLFELIQSTPVYLKTGDSYLLKDFVGNQFILKDDGSSYFIYDSNNNFIEGSFYTPSPYSESLQEDNELFYLGPANYYVKHKNKYYDLFQNQEVNFSILKDKSFVMRKDYKYESKNEDADSNISYTSFDVNEFNTIKNALYFEQLTQFPMNWFGECGFIALSILLGYYDTFYNDDFIPNDKTYKARYYKNVNDTLEFDHSKEEALLIKGKVPFQGSLGYSLNTWSIMPGTSYAMRDYFLDCFKSTILGIGGTSGYPMSSYDLNASFDRYMEYNCPSIRGEFMEGRNVVNPMSFYIDRNIPFALLLASSYKYDNNNEISSGEKAHIVVAYGYKDDCYLVHMGWNPGGKNYSKVMISKYVSIGNFGIQYTGKHKCSHNVCTSVSPIVSVCGCGSFSFD